jgi:hypothetical protein
MMKYKRFMVFTWYEYDNVQPFQCFLDSFDSIDDARDCALLAGDYDDEGDPLFCIFDRQEGVMA